MFDSPVDKKIQEGMKFQSKYISIVELERFEQAVSA